MKYLLSYLSILSKSLHIIIMFDKMQI
ncbi:hypothetical protein SaSA20_0547a [Streptococcus agalactiae]|nr:hypothetical protein SaSA20_0547a [Streptococcus agalactiae]